MGAGSSSISDLSNNVYLQRFTSPEILTHNDPFWNQLLSFSFSLPSKSSDYRLLDECIEPLFRGLIQNYAASGNISSLIRVFLSRATELKASAQCDNSVFTWQAHNALFIIRCVTKLLLERFTEEEVLQILATLPPTKEGDEPEDASGLMESLVCALVEVMVDVPLGDQTYALHLEATTTLLVLTSSLVFKAADISHLSIFRMLMSSRASIHACLLVKTLLKRFMAQDKQPKKDESGSVVLGIA
ncbi:unnamed protein product, partial [Meganyctiphanes norvegica]